MSNPINNDDYYDDDTEENYDSEEDGNDENEEELSNAMKSQLDLNSKLKEIMASNLDPVKMQDELNRLLGGAKAKGDRGDGGGVVKKRNLPPQLLNDSSARNNNTNAQRQQQQQHQQNRQQSPKPIHKPHIPEKQVALKSHNAGQTFSNHELSIMAKDNRRLLQKMIKIQTTTKPSNQSSHANSNSNNNAMNNTGVNYCIKSSEQINRTKKNKAISHDNKKFLDRLRSVKSSMSSNNPSSNNVPQTQSQNYQNAIVHRNNRAGGDMRGSGNVWGKNADRARMSRFKEGPSLSLPDWQG